MQDLVVYKLEQFETKENDCFILGSFESFHLGHLQLFNKANSLPGRNILVTFNVESGMPKFEENYFANSKAKYFQLARFPFDAVIELDFWEIKHLEGAEFIKLLSQNQKINLIGGKDFKFGNGAKWNLIDFKYDNATNHIVDFVKIQNTKISTSLIKQNLEFGKVEFANSMLVFEYPILAKVLDQNLLDIDYKVLKLHSGIYASKIYVDNLVFYALIHVGLNKQYHFQLIDFEQSNNWIDAEVYIEVFNEIRLIISTIDDQIIESDLDNAKQYFLNLLNKK
ncbi:FAD synthase [Mycoplasma nasistruthionis]|uniref:FAD synthase n=1 Tax=Mycoplasma nasistruthionis TaxID=353852 RepID=A0A5B7XV82_9MOLU|nr:hypothetical protein [Mycoplasma nasistruthionis]QCZ36758.1 hypothetical protein FG904_01895 [Mycoplasma nasistruthionis]